MRTNQEIETLIKGKNIVQFKKTQGLAWYGHKNKLEDNRNVKAIMYWNPTDRRLRGRPKAKWKDDTKIDLHAMKITEWKKRTEDKLIRKKIVEQAKTHTRL